MFKNYKQFSLKLIYSNQKHITPKRLNSAIMLRNKLGFISRPIRSTDVFFAQIWKDP